MASSHPPSDHFLRCWRRQLCPSCLDQPGCSWCPFACVPNTAAIPLLAPASDAQICPHRSERWELRTRPLGCRVSAITALSVLAAVASTLALVGLVCAAASVCAPRSRPDRWRIWAAGWAGGGRVGDGDAGWAFWRGWRGRGRGVGAGDGGSSGPGEEDPLLRPAASS
ncbi:hypothetical protein VTH06DRAFT_758 [Thermothelomyces fergusii]